MAPEMTATIAQWTIATLLERLADPRDPSGGGMLAAVTLAGASSTARMVIAVEGKRAARAPDRTHAFATAEAALARLTSCFLQQAEEDRTVLAQLLAALRAARKGGSGTASDDVRLAALAAAECPLATATAGLELLRQLMAVAPLCSAFVASDLGASGQLARAAIVAALLMAQANLPLLDQPARGHIAAQIRSTQAEADALANELSRALSFAGADQGESDARSST